MRPSSAADFKFAFDIVAAHHVENDVGAVTFGRLAHRLDEILLVVVDGARGAEAKQAFAFSALPTVTITRAPKAVAI